MFTICSGERSFSRSQRIETELKGHSVPGYRLSTLSIPCIKGDKLKQTNFNEFLSNSVMTKAKTKPF